MPTKTETVVTELEDVLKTGGRKTGHSTLSASPTEAGR